MSWKHKVYQDRAMLFYELNYSFLSYFSLDCLFSHTLTSVHTHTQRQ